MIGDRTGTIYIQNGQRLDLHRYSIDLPFNIKAYQVMMYKNIFSNIFPILVVVLKFRREIYYLNQYSNFLIGFINYELNLL